MSLFPPIEPYNDLFIKVSDLHTIHIEEKFSEAFARIECNYFIHKGWFDPEDQLLQTIPLIRHIPSAIVQERYDVVCVLQKNWFNSQNILLIFEDSILE